MGTPNFTENAKRIFDLRYPRKDDDGLPIESPAQTIRRVAENVAIVNALYPARDLGASRRRNNNVHRFPYRTARRQAEYLRKKGRRGKGWSLPVLLGHPTSMGKFFDAAQKYDKIITDLVFLPNSPTWTGAGTPLGQLAACFVLPVDDDLGRQRDSIFGTLNVAALIQQTGGGNGFSFGRLRPRGAVINTSMGKSTGPVGFMKVFDAAFGAIAQGGSRRGANMGVLPVSHPDIREFMKCKVVEGEIANFNISTAITDDFMEAVVTDEDFDLRFGGKVYETVRARALFREIAENAWVIGDPGNLFISRAHDSNPCPTRYVIEATNPCLSKDTMIAVADGRGAVTIGELVESGEDVPVYTLNRETLQVEIQMGVHPRITGRAMVYEVALNNGTSFKVTGNHKFILRDGTEKEALDLNPGDSLMPFSRWASTYNATSNHYWFVSNGFRTKAAEHRLISDFVLGADHHQVVHHANFDGLDNTWDNLIPVSDTQHRNIHDQRGDRNPMFGRTHTEDAKAKIGAKSLGRIHNRGKVRTAAHRSAISAARQAAAHEPVIKLCEWCHAPMILPYGRREQGYCSHTCTSRALAHRHEVIQARLDTRDASRDRKRQRQVEVFLDLAATLGREPLKVEWEQACREAEIPFRLAPPSATHQGTFGSYAEVKEAALVHNHRVVSITAIGEEIVYNMTVDAHHNYAIVAEVPRRGNPIEGVDSTLSGVFTTQCGEQYLGPYENCCLGSISVNKFVTKWFAPSKDGAKVAAYGEFDWKGFAEAVRIATQFLDDVVDANQYVAAVPELEEAAQGGRRIGLGLMGVADAMAMMGVRYGSEEGQAFLAQLTEFARFHCMLTSIERAKERGPFEWIEDSIYDPRLLSEYGFGVEVTRPLAPSHIDYMNGSEKATFKLWQVPSPIYPAWSDAWNMPRLNWDLVRDGILAHGIRNSCQFTFAPTGTISNVAGLEGSGLEPFFALAYIRMVMQEGENIQLHYLSPLLQRALELVANKTPEQVEEILAAAQANNGSLVGLEDLVGGAIAWAFPVAADVPALDHVAMQAAAQHWVDNSISKTINMPHEATVEDVEEAYLSAWKWGCKGITIYRQGSRDLEVLATTKTAEEAAEDELVEAVSEAVMSLATETVMIPTPEWPSLRPLPHPTEIRQYGLAARVFPVETFYGNIQVTITERPDYPGRPWDLRLQLGKGGNDQNANVEALGRTLSVALRCGVSVEALVEQLVDIGGHSSIGFGTAKVRSIGDGVGKLLRRLYLEGDRQHLNFGGLAVEQPSPQVVDTGVLPGVTEQITVSTFTYDSVPTTTVIGPEGMPVVEMLVPTQVDHRTVQATYTVQASGDICPSCNNATVVMESGCRHCEPRLGGCGMFSGCD